MAFETQRPHPGRRRSGMRAHTYKIFRFSTLLLVCLSMISAVVAYDMEADERAYNSRQYKKLARLGQIHIDRRPAPSIAGHRIEVRQDESSTSSLTQTSTSPSSTVTSESSVSPSTSFASTTSYSTTRGTPTTSTNNPSATVIETPIPSPFDTSLGSNFTSSTCPIFFNTFLVNTTFKSCHPVSLLLQNSNSFFQAERSVSLLSQTLDIACNSPLAICSSLMSSIAAQLIDSSNCGPDYAAQNPLVSQAYNGLIAYEPLYRATCLKNPDTGSYCFADAVTNVSSPSDVYPYYTALGLNMPASTRPTCSQCLQNTMGVFAEYTGGANQPLKVTYTPTAYQLDLVCGPTFVNTTGSSVSSASTTGGAAMSAPRTKLGLLVAAGLVMAGLLV